MPDFRPAAHYLPHETPMVLVEKVLSIGEEAACCSVKVTHEGILAPFLDQQNRLPAWFALEIMAQTIGVWSGWHNRHNGVPTGIGLLLGVRALKCAQPFFSPGSELIIRAGLLLRDEKIGNFECDIRQNGEPFATARLTTYQPDEQDIARLFPQK